MTALSRTDPVSYAEISDTHYEAAWRASQWEMNQPSASDSAVMDVAAASLSEWGSPASENPTPLTPSSSLHACIYHSVRQLGGLARRDPPNEAAFRGLLRTARQSVIQRISVISAESVQNLFPLIVQLQLLSDIESAWSIVQNRASAGSGGKSKTSMIDSDGDDPYASAAVPDFESFQRRLSDRFGLLVRNNFDMCEPVFALRGVVLHAVGEPQLLGRHIRSLASAAREANRPHVGMTALRQAMANPLFTGTTGSSAGAQHQLWTKSAFQLEDAQLLWSSGDADAAVRSARQVLRVAAPISSPVPIDTKSSAAAAAASAESDELNVLRVDAYCLIGEWLSKSYLEVSSGIRGYLAEAEKYV